MNKTIRVLHTEWSEGWGGQEIRIIDEMKVIRSKDVEVFLACKNNSIIKIKALESDIKVFTLPFKGNMDLKTLFSLNKIIKIKILNIIMLPSPSPTGPTPKSNICLLYTSPSPRDS